MAISVTSVMAANENRHQWRNRHRRKRNDVVWQHGSVSWHVAAASLFMWQRQRNRRVMMTKKMTATSSKRGSNKTQHNINNNYVTRLV